jgi:hypothetical protein
MEAIKAEQEKKVRDAEDKWRKQQEDIARREKQL